jgi:hypothetical protein
MEPSKLSSNPPWTFWLTRDFASHAMAGTGRLLVRRGPNIFDPNGEIQTADARCFFTSAPD